MPLGPEISRVNRAHRAEPARGQQITRLIRTAFNLSIYMATPGWRASSYIRMKDISAKWVNPAQCTQSHPSLLNKHMVIYNTQDQQILLLKVNFFYLICQSINFRSRIHDQQLMTSCIGIQNGLQKWTTETVRATWDNNCTTKRTSSGAHNKKQATSTYSCHSVFTDQSIFRAILARI